MSVDLITKSEAAILLGGASEPVSIPFVEKLLRLRRLPRVKISPKVVRIPRAAVEEFIAARTINAKEIEQ